MTEQKVVGRIEFGERETNLVALSPDVARELLFGSTFDTTDKATNAFNKRGYQPPPSEKRFAKIARYYRKNLNQPLITPLIVSIKMARKRYTAEQIIGHLRQAEIWTSEGKTIIEAVRELGISEQTYYRWRKEYGGMEVSQARRLKDLEQENGRLKRLVADQALDISILKEVSTGNF